MFAESEVVDQTSSTRELVVQTSLVSHVFAIESNGFFSVLPVVNLVKVDKDTIRNAGHTHTGIDDGSPDSFGVVVTLEEIDGAEHHIEMQVVIDK